MPEHSCPQKVGVAMMAFAVGGLLTLIALAALQHLGL
jgi:hypothetical protein